MKAGRRRQRSAVGRATIGPTRDIQLRARFGTPGSSYGPNPLSLHPAQHISIPGLGLSSLIAPDPAHRAALKRVFDRLGLGHSNPFSIAAFEAAYRGGAPWLDRLLPYLRDTREFVTDYLAARLPTIKPIPPEGTYLVWLDCRDLGMGDAALREFFVRQARVGLNPGISYGQAGNGFMRLNIGSPRPVIAEALERIAGALARR